MQNIAKCKGKLSITIGSVKSAITKFANKHHIPFSWQARFYDRIIRNREKCNRIAKYIENNPTS